MARFSYAGRYPRESRIFVSSLFDDNLGVSNLDVLQREAR